MSVATDICICGHERLERWRAVRIAKRRVRERLSGWNARTGVYEKGGLQPANAPAPPRGQHAVPNPPRGSGRK